MAGASDTAYHVWIRDWTAGLGKDGRTHVLTASVADAGIRLREVPTKPPAIHGLRGVSQKSDGVGRASHYYSLSRLETTGEVRLGGRTIPVTGFSWMDHEFGSNQLTPEQAGWDWFSVQLDDRRELMLYMIRRRDGRLEPASSGTLIAADGSTQHLGLSAFQVKSLRQ